ncbi:ABC transporter permease [Sporosarcina sp. 179-K 3D1 HS]|uniref:ABC transporter permease n=1 Tax=Sporosarcina sp. 179-K 3D1 HS TaxID=3232169 RepID=UPI0039A3C903
MFLAWREIKRNKLRFTLITGILLLVSYLVFFLSGLATGLQNLNRESVDKWEADAIVLTEESDKSLYQSLMGVEATGEVEGDKIAVLAQLSAIVGNGEKKQNVSIFGIEEDGFLVPSVTEGSPFSGDNEVIASDALKEDGFALGDVLHVSSSDEILTIVGFTDKARFNAAPVLYADLSTFHRVKYGEAAELNSDRINGIVIRTDGDLNAITSNAELEVIEVETFIENLPGYTEQNMTLTFMIYFLFVISSVIVAIFLYVLTVQKISLFGVMKAQGISSWYLSKSVIAQTFILAAVGVGAGFGLTLLSGRSLPSAVPVSFDLATMGLYGIVLIGVAIAGAVFSVLTIVRIDPLKAIGG